MVTQGSLRLLLVLLLISVVTAYDNGNPSLGGTPPMGWNTWCTGVPECGAPDYCNEKEVQSIADSLVESGMADLGYRFVNLDDCWSAETRTAAGELQGNPKRFPSGMAALADYIHSRGLFFGLYTCVGTETCRGGRPGSFGYYEQDASTLAGWGVDFVKADNCARPGGYTIQELYTNFSTALNATGRTILFSLCEWGDDDVETWGGKVGQMYRVQQDHLPFWEFPPLAAGAGFGQGTLDIINYMATLVPSQWVGPYSWMDPDFLETLMPVYLPFTESRTEFTFWCMWSAPLLIATDVRNMTQQKKSIVMNPDAISIDQDSLARGGDRVLFDNATHAQVWAKQLSGNRVAAVLFNPKSLTPLTISVTFADLGFPPDQKLLIRDVWKQQDLGIYSGSISSTVTHRDVFFFIATPQL